MIVKPHHFHAAGTKMHVNKIVCKEFTNQYAKALNPLLD